MKLLRSSALILFLIVLFGLGLRLYKIDSPIADWHAWRQADTAAVARDFYQHGYNPFLPHYNDMMPVAERNKAGIIPHNPHHYRLVEFSIYPTIVYLGYLINGGVTEWIARLVSVLFSLGSIVLVYFITIRYYSRFVGLLAAFLMAVLPYNVYFSRVILPEPSLIFFCLATMLFVDRWIWQGKKSDMVISLVMGIAAFLTKPMAVFYLLPLLVSYRQRYGKWWPIPIKYWLWAVIVVAPLLAWRIWIQQYPEGIPASNWLYNGNGIRLKPSWWHWLFEVRLGQQILTIFGWTLLIFGVIAPVAKKSVIFHWWLLSMLGYLIVFATGNVQHDYYQVLIVPPLVIMVARGFEMLWSKDGNIFSVWGYRLVAVICLTLMIYFGYQHAKGLYQINNNLIVIAGQAADKILPENARVLAPNGGDSSLLYYVNRPGWGMIPLPVDEMIRDYGATHVVSLANDSQTADLRAKYQVLNSDDNFWIIDLTQERDK